jgi:hypothetical protein
MVEQDISITKLFKGFQSQMINKLTQNRELILHPAVKGAATELEWINWLNDYLPKRYRVTSAFIIDSENNISDQIDLVIHDTQYSPFVFNQSDVEYIPAESVYAVFELKQELNSGNIKYAKDKVKSVRMLKRTSAQIVHAGGTYTPKKPHDIIGGLITLSSTYNLRDSSAFKRNILSGDDKDRINMGLCLNGGAFLIQEDKIDVSTNENSLLEFFLNLLNALQRIGTVTAMDIDEYKKYIVNG